MPRTLDRQQLWTVRPSPVAAPSRPVAAPSRPLAAPSRPLAWPSHVARARAAAGLVAAASTMLLLWGLGRPAFWLDEAATVVATRRSWTGLWVLVGGDEAPLVPYYALVKLTLPFWNLLSGNAIEATYRLPSVVAAVCASWVLTLWLGRNHGARLALAGAAALLCTVGLSRYGQEARPYAFVLLCSVLATAAWWRLARDRSRRWIPLYALALLGLIAAHPLSVLLIPAHLLAAAVASPVGRRRGAVLRTSVGAAAGLALASPVIWASSGAGGPTRTPPLTPSTFTSAFMHLLDVSPHSLVLVLAVAGLCRAGRGEQAAIARVAACWALLPLVLFVPVVIARPNLLLGRYVLFTLPGWAVLAGLGLVTLTELARHRYAGPAVGAVAVAVLSLAQAGGLHTVRTAAGHGEDIRPALAAAAARGQGLPLALPRLGAIELQAYRPGDVQFLVGLAGQDDQDYLWATQLPSEDRSVELRRHFRVGLLLRTPPETECPRGDDPVAAYVARCMPTWLSSRSYAVVDVGAESGRWIFAVLEREPRVRGTAGA